MTVAARVRSGARSMNQGARGSVEGGMRACIQLFMGFGLLVPACTVVSTRAADPAASVDGGVVPEDDAGGGVDGSVAVDGGSEGGVTTARCDPGKPFGAAGVVSELGTGGSHPFLSSDERTLLLTRSSSGAGFDLFTATRADRDAKWGALEPLAGVNGINHEYGASFSADELTLYYVRSGYTAYFAKRTSKTQEFGIGDPLSLGPAPSMSVGTPRGAASGVYYLGWRTGTKPALFEDVAPGYDQVSALTHDTPVDTFAIAPDEKTLYFTTVPDETTAIVHRATRTAITKPFTGGDVLSVLGGVRVRWVSEDDCVLYGEKDDAVVLAVRGK